MASVALQTNYWGAKFMVWGKVDDMYTELILSQFSLCRISKLW